MASIAASADLALQLQSAPPLTPAVAALGAIVLLLVLAAAVYRSYQRRHLADLSLLADVADSIAAATPDTDELAETAYLQSARLFDTDFFQLGLFHHDRYRTVIWIRDGNREPNEDFLLGPSPESLIGWVRRTGQTLIVRNFEAERGHLPAQPGYASVDPPVSGLFAPVQVGGEVLGLLAVQSRKRAAFNQLSERRLRFLAACVAVGLENVTLRAKSENRERHLAVLEQVSELLVPLRPLPEVVEDLGDVFRLHGVSPFSSAASRCRFSAA